MVDIDFLGQLIESMSDAVQRLEKAVNKNNVAEANELRTFIFDLHRKINEALRRKNV